MSVLVDLGAVLGTLAFIGWLAAGAAILVVYRRAGGAKMLAEMRGQPLKSATRPAPPGRPPAPSRSPGR